MIWWHVMQADDTIVMYLEGLKSLYSYIDCPEWVENLLVDTLHLSSACSLRASWGSACCTSEAEGLGSKLARFPSL